MKRTMAVVAVTVAVGGGLAVSAAAQPDTGSGRPLSTVLTPEQEVAPFVGIPGASGEFSARFNPGLEQICVDLRTEGVDLVLAHIHTGAAGTNGPVPFDFSSLIDTESGTAIGCLPADRELIQDIIADPSGYYVNVHEDVPPNAGFFQGVRGQLGR